MINDDYNWRNTPVDQFYTQDFVDALRDTADDMEAGKIPIVINIGVLRGAADTIERFYNMLFTD